MEHASPSLGELLEGHTVLDVECFDRIYCNVYQPKLQTSARSGASNEPAGEAADRPLTPGAPPRTLAAEQPPLACRGSESGGVGARALRCQGAGGHPGTQTWGNVTRTSRFVRRTPDGGTLPALRTLSVLAVRGWPHWDVLRRPGLCAQCRRCLVSVALGGRLMHWR